MEEVEALAGAASERALRARLAQLSVRERARAALNIDERPLLHDAHVLRGEVSAADCDWLLATLREPSLEPLRTRFAYVHALRPFTLEDTRNYVRYHIHHAGGVDSLITDDAVRRLFQASGGVPRVVNQLSLQALIHAVVHGVDQVDQLGAEGAPPIVEAEDGVGERDALGGI